MPELANNFKIPSEKASPVVENGQKVFTQTVRANSDAVTEIPPIPLAYFDPDAGDYVVAQTDPIPLKVAPAKVLTTADMEGLASTSVGREIQAMREGLSANYYGPEVLENQAFSPVAALVSPAYAALWSIPLIGLVGSVAFRLATRSSPETVARKRRRQACPTAIRKLRAVALAEANERHDLLIAALRGYVGDRFDRTAGSLTADDCHCIVLPARKMPNWPTSLEARDRRVGGRSLCFDHAEIDSATQSSKRPVELVQRIEEKSKR